MGIVDDYNKPVYWEQNERCGQNAPAEDGTDWQGMTCSLQKDHGGPHQAWWSHRLDDEIAVEWSPPVTPEEEAEAIQSILQTFGNTSTRPPPPTEGRL